MATYDQTRGHWRIYAERPGAARRRTYRAVTAPDTVKGRKVAEAAEAVLRASVAAEGSTTWPGADRRGTFGSFAAQWLDRAGGEADWTPGTAELHRAVLVDHVLPHIGTTPILDVTASDLDDMFAAWKRIPGRRGAPVVAGVTRARWARIVRTIFREAVRLGVIAIDPMNRTRPPRGKAPEKAIPTPAEVGDLFVVARSPLARLFFEVAAATGARAGSVRHLRWRDVDLETGSLYFGVTKEKRPYVVAIDDDTRASLADARRRARETAMAIGSPQIANRYLFSSEADGLTPWTESAASHAFRAAADQLDLDPGITLHSLRHFHATRCLTAGIPAKDVATRLGCTEANVIRTYSHRVESGNDRKAADLIGALLRDARSA